MSLMYAPRVCCSLAFVLFLGPAGCSPPRQENRPLTGVVTYGGEPVWEGRVTFLGPGGQIGTTTLAADGSYRMLNPPRGTVRVGVVNYPTAGSSPQRAPRLQPGQATSIVPTRPNLTLPARYTDPERSVFTLEVGPGEARLDIHLKREADDPPVLRQADLPSVGVEVGQMAPEIEGEAIDGKPLKLSDHRGKVVALLFWGHWCNLCRQRFDHDRALVERLKGRPFVLLGVNCDHERDLARRRDAERKINWQSWWDGGQAIAAPVASAWQVKGLPYLVLIDQKGVIRRRDVRGPDLDDAVAQLFAASH